MWYSSFTDARKGIERWLVYNGREVKQTHWQSVDVSKRPEMVAIEVMNLSLTVELPNGDLEHYREDIKPNLPWADDHFRERLNGPTNPGKEWKNWPWATSAHNFLDTNGQFTHTYQERYWPRYPEKQSGVVRMGIRYEYGDLADVINHLRDDPLSRQAYFPIWFPEDTGVRHQGRVPCSLGYHFLMRNNRLNIVYYLRSCDLIRHWADDMYLTVRLLLVVLDALRSQDKWWDHVVPGEFTCHTTSLHIFKNDYIKLKEKFS